LTCFAEAYSEPSRFRAGLFVRRDAFCRIALRKPIDSRFAPPWPCAFDHPEELSRPIRFRSLSVRANEGGVLPSPSPDFQRARGRPQLSGQRHVATDVCNPLLLFSMTSTRTLCGGRTAYGFPRSRRIAVFTTATHFGGSLFPSGAFSSPFGSLRPSLWRPVTPSVASESPEGSPSSKGTKPCSTWIRVNGSTLPEARTPSAHRFPRRGLDRFATSRPRPDPQRPSHRHLAAA